MSKLTLITVVAELYVIAKQEQLHNTRKYALLQALNEYLMEYEWGKHIWISR